MEDIFPSLLQKIKAAFENARLDSKLLQGLLEKLERDQANYLDANQYAIEIGEILSKVLGAYLNNDSLPNGKMYYNIAKRLLDDVLGRNYELVTDYTRKVQEDLNIKAKIGLSVQIPELNQDRIVGLVNRLASEEDFGAVKWLLDETIVNFTQSIVDDSIQKNAEFHNKVGLHPKITRKTAGKCCKWCQGLEGSYRYPSVPHDVYRRHINCRCTVEYNPRDGKLQNVHTKKWSNIDLAEVERRKQIGIESDEERKRKREERIAKFGNPGKSSKQR